jgi:tRNA uridine 5-carboxymethylaminomethyl modification enzyme
MEATGAWPRLPAAGGERALHESYDVLVVGGGHAGCEAALAAARMGCRTLLVTGSLRSIALMPCNPSIGGPAKGHLVREIDALGGEMGRNADRTFIQIRMLNTGKGPAVQALRAQSDKRLYQEAMQGVLARQAGLELREALVEELVAEELSPEECARLPGARRRVRGVRLHTGEFLAARTVVLTTGTFLRGRLITGEHVRPGGRAGEPPAGALSDSLRGLGFDLGRLKTGTPPRLDAATIDYAHTWPQPGSDVPLSFSFEPVPDSEIVSLEPDPIYPQPEPRPRWRRQMACYLVHTTPRTHEIIRTNLHRAPMFNGTIEGIGPRYCPSIEDKIVRFADKERHQLFLEPEGFQTREVYVQGANTSLPEDVQWAMIRSIPALEQARLLRIGYAVEYDYVKTYQTAAWLETKGVRGLFVAGQINGTSGYEEAAAQGIMAGINAALTALRQRNSVPPRPQGLRAYDRSGDVVEAAIAAQLQAIDAGQPVVLPRALAYIGVMLDDLTSKELDEPYRLHTSRAEYRLLLRHDNAHLRLTPIAYRLGLVSRERYQQVEELRDAIAWARREQARGRESATILGRLPEHLRAAVEVELRYAGYIRKQMAEVERAARLEGHRIPAHIDYASIPGLRTEARQKLARFRPATIGQAARINGVTPADIAVLLVALRKAAVASAS